LESQGVRALYTDLADAQTVRSVCQGKEVVFHVAPVITIRPRTIFGPGDTSKTLTGYI